MKKYSFLFLLCFIGGWLTAEALDYLERAGWFTAEPAFIEALAWSPDEDISSIRQELMRRFPPGTKSIAFYAFLREEGFKSRFGTLDGRSSASYFHSRSLWCPERWVISWVNDTEGALSEIDISYEPHC